MLGSVMLCFMSDPVTCHVGQCDVVFYVRPCDPVTCHVAQSDVVFCVRPCDVSCWAVFDVVFCQTL